MIADGTYIHQRIDVSNDRSPYNFHQRPTPYYIVSCKVSHHIAKCEIIYKKNKIQQQPNL